MFASAQIALAIALIALVGLWRRAQSKRKHRSWDDIVSALSASDWGMQEVSERYLYRSGINATPADIWNRIDGIRGLRAMYRNAPLLVQLADYASEHSGDPDTALLEELRSDAFQIRWFVLSALSMNMLFRFKRASNSAHRATALYSEILAIDRDASEERCSTLSCLPRSHVVAPLRIYCSEPRMQDPFTSERSNPLIAVL